MPGMVAHSGSLWSAACDARDRAIAITRANPSAWPNDAIVAIVLAAAAMEAFINELAEAVALQRDSPWRQNSPISAPLRAFADALQKIEESRGSLTLKYLIASQTLVGVSFDKGTNPYQDFAVLINLRNDIMHLKPRDRFDQSASGSIAFQPPAYIRALQQRGLARTPDKNTSISWLNALQTAEMAIWACDTSIRIILAVLNFIPDDPIPGNDSSWMFKIIFRKG